MPLLLVLFSCASLPKHFDRPRSYAYTDTQDTVLGKALADARVANAGQSRFHLLEDGLDAFVARAVLAHLAERSIDAQYYLYHDDLVGRLFTNELLKAADRGVRVRLLVDDMDLEGRDLGGAFMDAHPNIEVRIFNPFSRKVGRASQYVTRLGVVTRRMHNKSFTVDNQVTVLSGRNIGNEYFEADPDLAFSDLDVMVIGPVAGKVSTAFDQYWNSELAYPANVLIDQAPTPEEIQQMRHQLDIFISGQADSVYLEALRNSSLAQQLKDQRVTAYWGEADVIYDQPEKLLHAIDETKYHMAPKLKPYLEAIENELIVFSPYFVPGKKGTAFLCQLAQRGVRVRILTNSLASNDVGIVHAGYSRYRKKLLRAGVELYEMNKKLTRQQRKGNNGSGGSSKASLHAKSFVFDRKQVFVGSFNLDPRSVVQNDEIGVVFSQADIAGAMGDWFDQNIEALAFRLELSKNKYGKEQIYWHGIVDGEPQTFDVDPHTGFWRRFGIYVLGILPIESQL